MKKSEGDIMEYKYEIHSHTKNTSWCGQLDAAELVEKYKDAGYSGIVITDHYSPMTFHISEFFNKKKAIDHFLEGYRKAKALETEDFSVLPPDNALSAPYTSSSVCSCGLRST